LREVGGILARGPSIAELEREVNLVVRGIRGLNAGEARSVRRPVRGENDAQDVRVAGLQERVDALTRHTLALLGGREQRRPGRRRGREHERDKRSHGRCAEDRALVNSESHHRTLQTTYEQKSCRLPRSKPTFAVRGGLSSRRQLSARHAHPVSTVCMRSLRFVTHLAPEGEAVVNGDATGGSERRDER
jgi:hypothetical protein